MNAQQEGANFFGSSGVSGWMLRALVFGVEPVFARLVFARLFRPSRLTAVMR